jgi:HlyD family secretion protein
VGTLERHRIELRAERQEPILRLAVLEGARVRRGEVIVELDGRRITAELEQALASRDLQEARLAEVVRGARPEEVERARAQLAEAEAALIEQRPRLVRAREMVSRGVEPQSVLDAARASHAAAEARVLATRAVLEELLNGATVEELDQFEAELAQRRAEVAKLMIDADRMVVKAPRDGTIDALPYKVGDEPPAGSTVAVLLAGGAPFARVYVPAEIRPEVAAGLVVSVSVDGFDQPFSGTVRTVSSEASFTPYFALTERDRGHLAYVAEIDLPDQAAGDLPTGLPVEVSF